MSKLTSDRLRELLDYDQATGVFTWKASPSWRVHVGKIAGCLHSRGYIKIRIDRKQHNAHRLAWLYVHGKWPDGAIDHKNGMRSDNRIENIRQATNGENQQNLRRCRTNNRSGFLGAMIDAKSGKKWRSQIKIEGVRHYLGYHDSAEKAHAAYLAAKAILHPFQTIA